jgi:hypothetical protein
LGILSTKYAANIRIFHRKNAANNVFIRRILLGGSIMISLVLSQRFISLAFNEDYLRE